MPVAFHYVFTILVLYSTFYICVNTLPITQDNKQTNGENLRVYTRNKRSGVTLNFCRNKKILYHRKCRTPEEYRRLIDDTKDYEDFSPMDILLITNTEENKVINIQTSAASDPTTFETTHTEPTKVPSSSVTNEIRTSTSTISPRIPDEDHKHRKLKDGTRNDDDFLTTKILFVNDTPQVAPETVTYIKTSAASETTTFETTHAEPTKVPPGSVTKEVNTVQQLNTTVSTSTNSTRDPDKFIELGMKISTFSWIVFGFIGVFVALCVGCLLYCCLKRKKKLRSYSPSNLENNNNEVEAVVLLKTSKSYTTYEFV